MPDEQSQGTLFIMVDGATTTEGVAKFAGPTEITVEKLREHLQSFVSKVGGALTGIAAEMGSYQLQEVEVEASFNAETGFVFVAKAGVEGSVKLRFIRK
jgi:hypothetical protein